METDEVTTKRCSKCGEVKAISEFGNNKRYNDGLQVYCKTCYRLISKQHRESNVEKFIVRRKEERIKYKAKINASRKKWRETNKNKEKSYKHKSIDKLSTSYVVGLIGIGVKNTPDFLIELKREQLKHKRLIKELKTLLTETEKETQ